MRIALVTEAFHPTVDTDTAMVKQIVDRYVDAGHRVLLVTSAPGLASYRGCRVARVRMQDLGASLVAAARVGDELDAFAPDVVQVHSPRALGARALAEARAAGLPTLVVQSVPVANPAGWRRQTAGADRVLATSAWLADRLGPARADVWRPGVDVDAFSPRLRSACLHEHWTQQRHGGPPLVSVGYVGDLEPGRGARRLAELAVVPGARTIVVGVGPRQAWLRRHLPGARFSAPLTRGELGVALASLDVVVETSPGATSGALLREAAASGVPVVARSGSGAEEVVEAGGTGLLYGAHPGALAAAVRTLVHDSMQRAVLGHQAWAAAQERDCRVAAAELGGWAEAVAHGEPGPRRAPLHAR